MTSRLRSSTSIPKERSKATFLGSDTFYYEPEETTGKSYGRPKQDNTYRFGDFRGACLESNGRRHGEETEEDPDLLYKRSKDRFGSWDIRDIAGDSSKRLRDGKFDRTITETSKNILGSREEERNGSRRSGDTMEKTEKEKNLESPRNGSFLGESLKIRRNGESQKKTSFPLISADAVPSTTEDRRIIVETTISDRARTREENEDEDDLRRHRHRHRRRHRYIFDGTCGEDRRGEEETREEGSRGIDRRRSKSVEKVSRSYEHFIGDKDSSHFREDEQRIPRFAANVAVATVVASDETNDVDRESDHEEDPDIKHEENDPRGVKENSSRKNNRYVVESTRNRSISKDVQEGEGTGLEDNVRRANRPFLYAGLPTEEFDVRIQRYERGLPELGRDSNFSKRSVSRGLDRSPSKRDSSKEHDREATRRISFSDVDASRKSSTKDSTTITTRRPTFKDQDNGVRPRNLIKNDHAGGIKCTIKSRSNDTTEKNCLKGESTDLGRKCSFKGQRPEFGKISFETQDGEIVGKRSSLRDEHTHGHTSDKIFLRVEKAEDERKRTVRYESPSSLERIPRDKQKGQVATSNEKDAKSSESVNATTSGRRRRISFKDRDIDRSERRSSYVDKDSNEEETRKRSDCSFDDRFETSEFDRNDSASRERSGRYRWKKTVDGDRSDIDSRAHPQKERAPSPEKKYERRSGALTPPRGRRGGGEDGGGEKDQIRSNESWREDNRLFATRYLRENGRATVRKDSVDDEDDRDSELEPDVGEIRSITVNGPQDRANNRIDPDTRGRIASTIERNGTTIVRILTGAGEATSSRGDLERRRRRRGVQQELSLEHRRRRFDASRYDSEEEAVRGEKVGVMVKEGPRKVQQVQERDHEEEEEGRDDNDDEYRQDSWRGSRRNDGLMPGIAGSTPSRRLWNYREGVWHFSESIAFNRTFMIQKREATFINRWRR